MLTPGSLTRRLSTTLLAIGLCAPAFAADDIEDIAFEDQRRELLSMINRPMGEANDYGVRYPGRASRQSRMYDFDFEPGGLERIVLTDYLGESHVYHYLPFFIRNRPSVEVDAIEAERGRRAAVYQRLVDQYQLRLEDGNLKTGDDVDDDVAESMSMDNPGTILENMTFTASKRRANIAVEAFDENGTRLSIFDGLDEVDPAGTGFTFDDHGERRVGYSLDRVRRRIEEKEGRKLLTLAEIAVTDLPVYDANRTNPETGWAVGELGGVVIFDRLPPDGDQFEVHFHGLTNKMRRVIPDYNAFEEEDRLKLTDHVNTEVYRRTYVMDFSRPGDEFFRGVDDIVTTDKGWEWIRAFNSIETRKLMAYTDYILNNLENMADNPGMRQEFWERYDRLRERVTEQADYEAIRERSGGLPAFDDNR